MKVESGMQNIMQRVKKKNMDAILYGHKFINHNNSNESLVKGTKYNQQHYIAFRWWSLSKAPNGIRASE